MPHVRVYVSPTILFAALILLWIAAVYLGFFLLPTLPFSPYSLFILFLTIIAWLGAVTLTIKLVLVLLAS
jgi:hypothetical protein